MPRADEMTAQAAETPGEAQSIGETPPLPRRFLATAGEPVTRITDHSDETTERVRVNISIEYSIETLEEFTTFWGFCDLRSWKRAALEALLGKQEPDTVTYAVDEDDLEEWNVQVDGRVEAFAGLVETMADYTGSKPLTRDAIPHRIAGRINGLTDGRRSTNDVLGGFADELSRAELWGAGAYLTLLNVRHAHYEDIEQLTATIARTLGDDGGEE
ncbi:hypothetical protein CV102_18385 [Natronococcus pandeyae]|uniref:Uncharacterized protein n=1 Tax=Natronococcus pandeyae TaxID=2055836 RepID=A0A8J8Q2F8_9EURY|nr:hypothetical protein [Natronococcus pandeyae]TYL37273.1 hypothetical protein CV102_18385 [Natronococcus pandeyae]